MKDKYRAREIEAGHKKSHGKRDADRAREMEAGA
jgi:hypothetical protein